MEANFKPDNKTETKVKVEPYNGTETEVYDIFSEKMLELNEHHVPEKDKVKLKDVRFQSPLITDHDYERQIKLQMACYFGPVKAKKEPPFWESLFDFVKTLDDSKQVKNCLEPIANVCKLYYEEEKAKFGKIPNFLSHLLYGVEKEFGFSTKKAMIRGFADEKFSTQLVSQGIHFKDCAFEDHGYFTHRFQWFVALVLEKHGKIKVKAVDLYKGSTLYSPSSPNVPIWEFAVDCRRIKTSGLKFKYTESPTLMSCRAPEYLNLTFLPESLKGFSDIVNAHQTDKKGKTIRSLSENKQDVTKSTYALKSIGGNIFIGDWTPESATGQAKAEGFKQEEPTATEFQALNPSDAARMRGYVQDVLDGIASVKFP